MRSSGLLVTVALVIPSGGCGESGGNDPETDRRGAHPDAGPTGDARPDMAVPPPADAGRDASAPARPDLGPDADNHWARLAAGCFEMGSDSMAGAMPPHEVCLGAFELSRAEVTNAEFDRCVEAGACDPPHLDDGECYAWDGATWALGTVEPGLRAAENPVVCVDWFQAVAYAAFIGGRLPTEAEWEYAAQSGGLGTVYPWGDEYPDCDRAVMSHRGPRCEAEGTVAPCSRPAGRTAQNVCDLAGNVWEWVEDAYSPDYEGLPTDGSAYIDADSEHRVVRGGGWPVNNADYLRTRYRDDEPAEFRYDFVGFRVAR